MGRLGEVLELIHSSRRSFRTARVSGRTGNSSWRLWWAGDDHFRFEGDGGSINVRAGASWWILDRDGEAHSNEGRSDVGLGMQPEFGLLHTRGLLAAALLEIVREEEVAGRPAAILRARPRPGAGYRRWWDLTDLQGVSDPLEIPIDLERGVALGGFRFQVDGIEFDEDFPRTC